MDSPFFRQGDQWYVCPTFNSRPTPRILQDILTALLERHPASQVLIIRPMAAAEVKLLERYRRDFDAEAFAVMVPTDKEKLG